MIRVVIDTNVFVSANLVEEGPSAAILYLAANNKIRMVVSEPILAEYEVVLRQPRLKLDPRKVTAALRLVRRISIAVKPSLILRISVDESDNRFYECAHAGRAAFLITGNRDHFPEDYRMTRVVTPREFVDLVVPLLAQSLSRSRRKRRHRPG